ncbi:glycosyltransferase family 25 protein [Candidatus Rhabdochlamydia sp. T3358]|uniref:glycosyltransferase family 25 protein n=1 Tax=Candidatus Rhabdochlamydia sp. T3358 TaxID=2099795 RepID=UPI0010B6E02D|nr:glycosyltransferase family 25 protein [Candidatus Rhabdochlamydia sp. T3358]VHO04983.1 Glycosyltransferase family 25 (LPS biosynthesis protein) [Candidatus Rhabdochlamydia sp. T3358]
MIKWVVLSCVLLFNILHAAIEDYFKKISDKSASHQIRNIDFIYMINLDERPEKYQISLEQIAPYEIFPYRFSAVNGWELSLAAINAMGLRYESWMQQGIWGTFYPMQHSGSHFHEIMQVNNENYFCHCMSKGAIGIVLSHLSILQDAYDSGYETIWVMEDDIQVIRNPLILSDLIDELDNLVGKSNWDILFTDQDTKGRDGRCVPCFSYAQRPNFFPLDPEKFSKRYNVSPNLRYVGARYGAYSMIVRRSGMRKILNFIKNYSLFLPFDMEYTQPDQIRLFTVIDDVVSTLPAALSDNSAPYYLQKK